VKEKDILTYNKFKEYFMSLIVLTGGGTAGHVTPHLALIDDLRKHFSSIAYIGSCGVEKQIIAKTGIKFYEISSVKFVRGNMLKNLLLPFKLMKAKQKAAKILKELHPSVIFSKGGYVSVPVVLAAKKLGIPVVCHESDLSCGLANRVAAKHAASICTTFKKTAEDLGEKGVFSGSPINESSLTQKKTAAKTALNIKTTLPILLVTGGSLGSVAINNAVFSALEKLTKSYYVIHVVGKNNTNSLKLPNYRQIEYAYNMSTLICAADVVISRAGSNTIFELAFARKPMLLIPLPKGASRGDQVENANYFHSRGIAHLLKQEELTADSLIKATNLTLAHAEELIKNIEKYNPQNGTKIIINEILKHAKK